MVVIDDGKLFSYTKDNASPKIRIIFVGGSGGGC